MKKLRLLAGSLSVVAMITFTSTYVNVNIAKAESKVVINQSSTSLVTKERKDNLIKSVNKLKYTIINEVKGIDKLINDVTLAGSKDEYALKKFNEYKENLSILNSKLDDLIKDINNAKNNAEMTECVNKYMNYSKGLSRLLGDIKALKSKANTFKYKYQNLVKVLNDLKKLAERVENNDSYRLIQSRLNDLEDRIDHVSKFWSADSVLNEINSIYNQANDLRKFILKNMSKKSVKNK
ncbi:MAG: hypothetical protein QXD03_05540 [Candidatus Anstonellales archaeon]